MFDTKYSKIVLLPLLAFALSSMLLLLPYNNIQFIILAGFPFLLIVAGFIFKRKLILELKPVDISWILFIILGFVSFLWATNPSLVWYRGFAFIGLFIISLLFRDLIKYPLIRKMFPLLMSGLFIIIFVQHLMAVHFEITFLDKSWNNFLSRNSNVTTCYLVSLFPFLLFKQSKNQFYRFFKILSSILILNILFLANVKIVILSFLMIMIYYFYSNQRKLLFVLFSMLVFGVIILNGFFSYDEIMSTYFSEIYKPDTFSRMSLVDLSKSLIQKNPIIGVGQGNWVTEVYNADLSLISPFNNSDDFVRLHSHNIYLKIAGELGVLGLLLFLIPFVITIYTGIKKRLEFDYVDKAAFATVLSYLLVSCYYGGINLYEYNFSGVEVLAFICMGILSRKLFDKGYLVNYIVIIPLIVITTIWFTYSAISWHNVHSVIHHKESMPISDKIDNLTNCYNSTFFNHYGFNNPIDKGIAELYAQNGDIDKAMKHYEQMVELSPYDCNGLLSYSKFLIANNMEFDKAKSMLQKILSIQNTHIETQTLLSELDQIK